MEQMPPAGWYPDPSGDATKVRWWDGSQWTDNYAAAQPQAQQPYAAQQTSAPQQPVVVTCAPYRRALNQTDQTLRLIAFILNLLTVVALCWLIVPLAWTIPMTVHSWGIYKGTKPNTVAFGICTLIFVDIISGVLLLVSTKDE